MTTIKLCHDSHTRLELDETNHDIVVELPNGDEITIVVRPDTDAKLSVILDYDFMDVTLFHDKQELQTVPECRSNGSEFSS